MENLQDTQRKLEYTKLNNFLEKFSNVKTYCLMKNTNY